jgi:hypothetical protein
VYTALVYEGAGVVPKVLGGFGGTA